MSETTPATCPDPAHSKQAAQQTALREEHARLGASFTTFGGWEMPLKYHNELIEHRAVRGAAGIFDLSHMGQIWVQGPQAGAFLDYALVSNLSTIPAGKAKYSLMCSPSGGIIDDLICYRHPSAVGDESYLVVPNAANTAIVYAEFLDRSQGFEVSLTDASTTTSLIALQGPKSAHILLSLVPAEQAEAVLGLKYYAATEVAVAGVSGVAGTHRIHRRRRVRALRRSLRYKFPRGGYPAVASTTRRRPGGGPLRPGRA